MLLPLCLIVQNPNLGPCGPSASPQRLTGPAIWGCLACALLLWRCCRPLPCVLSTGPSLRRVRTCPILLLSRLETFEVAAWSRLQQRKIALLMLNRRRFLLPWLSCPPVHQQPMASPSLSHPSATTSTLQTCPASVRRMWKNGWKPLEKACHHWRERRLESLLKRRCVCWKP